MNNKENPEKEYLGYEVKEDEIKLTNENVFKELGIDEDTLKELYPKFKNGVKYSKAVKVFNTIYNNDMVLNIYQGILKDTTNNPNYDITLIFYDSVLLYEKLKENNLLLDKKKKTNLLTERITPKTEFLKWCSYVELALRNINLVDEVTEKQVLALVLQTVGEANNIENIQYL